MTDRENYIKMFCLCYVWNNFFIIENVHKINLWIIANSVNLFTLKSRPDSATLDTNIVFCGNLRTPND